MAEFTATESFKGIAELDHTHGLVRLLDDSSQIIDMRDVESITYEYDDFSAGSGDIVSNFLGLFIKAKEGKEAQEPKQMRMAIVLTLKETKQEVRIDFLNSKVPMLYNINKAFDRCYKGLKSMQARFKEA